MIPVMISAPWIPINQSKLQINKEISTAISVSDASTSGRTASLINSGYDASGGLQQYGIHHAYRQHHHQQRDQQLKAIAGHQRHFIRQANTPAFFVKKSELSQWNRCWISGR